MPFSNYENNPNQGFHIDTPNVNYGLGRLVAELLPGDEDPQFENTVSILSESLLPQLLSIVPDIKRESGKENEYREKFNSALLVTIARLHDEISTLGKEGKDLEEYVWLTFKKVIVRKYLLEHNIENFENLKNRDIHNLVIKSFLEALGDEDNEIHIRAIAALQIIGVPAINPLIEALGDEDKKIHIGAVAALQNIGEPAINSLIAALGDENEETQTGAIAALKNIGESTMDSLIIALRDENAKIRGNAAITLGIMGKLAAVNPLIAALRDGNEEIRGSVTYALCKIGEPAVKPLTAVLNDENEIVQQLAASCLKKIVGKDFD